MGLFSTRTAPARCFRAAPNALSISLGSSISRKAAGHDSVQMHKRYVRLRQEDIASAFGTSLEMATEIVTEEKAVSAK